MIELDEISKQSLKESKERMQKELEEDYKLFGIIQNPQTYVDGECFFYVLAALMVFLSVLGVLIYKSGCV